MCKFHPVAPDGRMFAMRSPSSVCVLARGSFLLDGADSGSAPAAQRAGSSERDVAPYGKLDLNSHSMLESSRSATSHSLSSSRSSGSRSSSTSRSTTTSCSTSRLASPCSARRVVRSPTVQRRPRSRSSSTMCVPIRCRSTPPAARPEAVAQRLAPSAASRPTARPAPPPPPPLGGEKRHPARGPRLETLSSEDTVQDSRPSPSPSLTHPNPS